MCVCVCGGGGWDIIGANLSGHSFEQCARQVNEELNERLKEEEH